MFRPIARAFLLFTLLTSLWLAGCGGGGGDVADTADATGQSSPDPSPRPTQPVAPEEEADPTAPEDNALAHGAHGLWTDSDDQGDAVWLWILDDGRAWMAQHAGGQLMQVVRGTSTQTAVEAGASWSLAGMRFALQMSATSGYNIDGTVDPGRALAGTDIDARALTLAFQDEHVWPAELADAVGTFRLQGASLAVPLDLTVTVAADGHFLYLDQGCEVAGRLTPHASGHRLYDVRLTFTGAPCVFADGAQMSGMAAITGPNVDVHLLAVLDDLSDGLFLAGSRL